MIFPNDVVFEIFSFIEPEYQPALARVIGVENLLDNQELIDSITFDYFPTIHGNTYEQHYDEKPLDTIKKVSVYYDSDIAETLKIYKMIESITIITNKYALIKGINVKNVTLKRDKAMEHSDDVIEYEVSPVNEVINGHVLLLYRNPNIKLSLFSKTYALRELHISGDLYLNKNNIPSRIYKKCTCGDNYVDDLSIFPALEYVGKIRTYSTKGKSNIKTMICDRITDNANSDKLERLTITGGHLRYDIACPNLKYLRVCCNIDEDVKIKIPKLEELHLDYYWDDKSLDELYKWNLAPDTLKKLTICIHSDNTKKSNARWNAKKSKSSGYNFHYIPKQRSTDNQPYTKTPTYLSDPIMLMKIPDDQPQVIHPMFKGEQIIPLVKKQTAFVQNANIVLPPKQNIIKLPPDNIIKNPADNTFNFTKIVKPRPPFGSEKTTKTKVESSEEKNAAEDSPARSKLDSKIALDEVNIHYTTNDENGFMVPKLPNVKKINIYRFGKLVYCE
jgi:hypothetical protein